MLTFVFMLTALLQAAPDPMNEPFAPFKIADNLYYVGTSDLACYLVTTPDGDILIDAGFDSSTPIITANLEKLGFKLGDVKILLNTQAHNDHSGGFAAMKRATGAQLFVMDPDADLIELGGHGDFLFGDRKTFPRAKVDRRLKDGDVVRLGGVELTAHLTPGHTRGCTTWTWTATDRGKTYRVVDVGGATINPGTRFGKDPSYAGIADDYARTFVVLKSLPCDIFLGAHGQYYGMKDKAAARERAPGGANPFVDPAGYKAFVKRTEQDYLTVISAGAK